MKIRIINLKGLIVELIKWIRWRATAIKNGSPLLTIETIVNTLITVLRRVRPRIAAPKNSIERIGLKPQPRKDTTSIKANTGKKNLIEIALTIFLVIKKEVTRGTKTLNTDSNIKLKKTIINKVINTLLNNSRTILL